MTIQGCTPNENTDNTDTDASTTLAVTRSGITLSANYEREVTNAATLAGRRPKRDILTRQGSTEIRAAELPFLVGSEIGREFLEMEAPRALARGAPAESCPAVTLSAPGAADTPAAVGDALRRCLDALGPRAGEGGCGCEVLAYDDVVAVAQADLAYSTGISARLLAPALGIDALLVADDVGEGVTELRDLVGPVATLRHAGDGSATLTFADRDGTWRGDTEAKGFRRGRLAEVMTLTDGAGREIRLAIGFSPRELEDSGLWHRRNGD